MSHIPGITIDNQKFAQSCKDIQAAHPYNSSNGPTQAYQAAQAAHSSAAHSSSDSVTLSPQAQALMRGDDNSKGGSHADGSPPPDGGNGGAQAPIVVNGGGDNSAYWTPARRAEAKPVNTVLPGSSPIPVNIPRTDPNDVKGTGNATAKKNADGTWTTTYNGQTYTVKNDGKVYDKDGKEVAHVDGKPVDGKGNIYGNDGKVIGTYTVDDQQDKAVVDVTGDPKKNINMSKDGTYSAKGDATAHKNSDGTWTATYKGQTYTSNGKDGKIYDKDGKEVAHADGNGNIYGNDGNLIGTYVVAGDNGDNAIIDVNGDNSDNTTMYW